MRFEAHAKLNLALAVDAPVPPSGYHPLCSWFVPLELSDTVSVTPADHTSLDVRWHDDAPKVSPIDWPRDRDLCVKAHRVFEEFLGARHPVHITVVKRIPVGGGLGGGSSDAAATLLALRSLFAPELTTDQLVTMAMRVGSDVAYFCDVDAAVPSRAIVEGFGERITRVRDTRIAHAVLILPPFGCPTGEVYKRTDAIRVPRHDFALRCEAVKVAAHGSAPIDSVMLFNDLAQGAFDTAPALIDIARDARTAIGRDVHVTGSGSTLFTLATPDEAHDIAAVLEVELRRYDCSILQTGLR